MKTWEKITLIIAGCMLSCGVLLGMIGFAVAGGDIGKVLTDQRTKNLREIVQSFDSIDIDTFADSVELSLSEDGACYVELYEGSNALYHVEVRDGTLLIRLDFHKEWYEYITVNALSERTIKLFLPDRDYDTVEIHTNDKQIDVDKKLRIGKPAAKK